MRSCLIVDNSIVGMMTNDSDQHSSSSGGGGGGGRISLFAVHRLYKHPVGLLPLKTCNSAVLKKCFTVSRIDDCDL